MAIIAELPVMLWGNEMPDAGEYMHGDSYTQ